MREDRSDERPSKQHVADTLRKMGYDHAADEALRVLPDRVDDAEAERFCQKQGIFHDDLISRMGGSP